MSAILGNLIVILVLLAVVALAVRSILRDRKQGGCSGDCAHCGCCHGQSVQKPPRS